MASPRIACIDVPALPLQILRRDRPEWAGLPIAVVEDDRPQAKVQWVSRSAQQLGIRVGMRYAAALGISRELRAAPIAAARMAEVRAQLAGALHRCSPRVEPDAERPGVIWIDPSGMVSLFGSYERWAQSIAGELVAHDLFGAVVVGFVRMRCWAIARSRRDAFVVASEDEERRLAGRVAIARLDVPPELDAALEVLGLRTLDDLLALAPGELSVRFGPEAARLHALFAGALPTPMSPLVPTQPIAIEAELDPPDDDHARLLFCAKGALHALMIALGHRRLALAALRVTLALERGLTHVEELRPARATRDAAMVLELLRLRLANVSLPERVARLHLEAEPAPPDGAQLSLLEGARRRDPDAASRGLARLRAAFGDAAVTRAQLADDWLPERQFRWEPVSTIALPRRARREEEIVRGDPPPAPPAAREGREDAAREGREDPRVPPLVRRLFPSPRALAPDREGRPICDPPIAAMSGPYRLESGWWAQSAIRDYWYAERADGALLWLYRDTALDRWFVQGIVD
jgi:protein ImuB